MFGYTYLQKNENGTVFTPRGGGGGGVLNKVLYGETPPRGLTPYLFIHNFLVEKVLLSYNFH